MVDLPLRSVTDDASLEAVTARLTAQTAVAGILYIGSTGQEHFHAASDYDLLLLVDNRPVPIQYLITTIAGRLSDIIIITVDELETRLQQESALVNWLGQGEIVYDRDRLLATARAHLPAPGEVSRTAPITKLNHLNGINYNLRQNERMWRQPEPTYQHALAIRLLYSVSDILVAYFALRDLPWQGEKEAIHHWQRTDPSFWRLLDQYLHSATLEEQMPLYRRLAAAAVAPAGPLWPADASHMSLAGSATIADIETGWQWWRALVRSI